MASNPFNFKVERLKVFYNNYGCLFLQQQKNVIVTITNNSEKKVRIVQNLFFDSIMNKSWLQYANSEFR